MADEPKKDHPEDIESILTDLDAILTDMGGDAAPAPAPPPAAAAPPPKIDVPKPAPTLPPVAPPPPPAAAAPPPPPPAAAPPPPAAKPPSIELAPREGMIAPKPVPEPPKPAPAPPPPAPAPPPPAPKPAPAAPPPAAAPAPAEAALPPDTPKEQIRRVAYVYTSSCSEAKAAFAAFLSQAARTISKKPLFLREVLAIEVAAASDPNAVVEKAKQAKAVAVLAVVDGWPAAKVDDLSEACSRANLLFRSVAPGDGQKKSTAVDIIVDMMLLPGES